jgi:hypothetical protein
VLVQIQFVHREEYTRIERFACRIITNEGQYQGPGQREIREPIPTPRPALKYSQ